MYIVPHGDVHYSYEYMYQNNTKQQCICVPVNELNSQSAYSNNTTLGILAVEVTHH